MENSDKELIRRVIGNDVRLRRLYEQHLSLENRLGSLGTKSFLTANEQMEERRLKKQKLHGVDQMMELLSAHR